MSRTLVLVSLVVVACGVAKPTPTLREVMGDIPEEVSRHVDDLHEILEQRHAGDADLYRRIDDLRLGPDLAILFDRAGRLEGDGLEPIVERYVDYVGNLLLGSGDVDVAVADDDIVGLAMAWVAMETSSGGLAVALGEIGCRFLVPAFVSDLCWADPVLEYQGSLHQSVRRFTSRYRPVVGLPAGFSEAVRDEIVSYSAPDVVVALDAALGEVAELTPPPAYSGLHQSVTRLLERLRSVWRDLDEPRWAVLMTELDAATCDSVDGFETAAQALAPTPDSVVSDIVALLVDGPGMRCTS